MGYRILPRENVLLLLEGFENQGFVFRFLLVKRHVCLDLFLNIHAKPSLFLRPVVLTLSF